MGPTALIPSHDWNSPPVQKRDRALEEMSTRRIVAPEVVSARSNVASNRIVFAFWL